MDGAIGGVTEVHVPLGKRFWECARGAASDRHTAGTRGTGLGSLARPGSAAALSRSVSSLAPARLCATSVRARWATWVATSYRRYSKRVQLPHPISVEATCHEIGPEVHPRSFRVTYEFPARGDMPPVTLVWHDEGFEPPRPPRLEADRRVNDVLYIGDRGTLMGHRLVPETDMQKYGRPTQRLAPSPGHDNEWVEACRGGSTAGSDFVAHSGLLTETALLGNIAMVRGKKLLWDGPNLRVTNDDEANAMLQRKYRPGWTLPEA